MRHDQLRPFARAAIVFAISLVVLAHVGRLLEPAAERAGGLSRDTGVMLLVDVSGSMAGGKILRAREAVRKVAESLPDGTVVGLRTFATDTNLLAAPAANAADSVARQSDRMDATSGTNIWEGLHGAGRDMRATGIAKWRLVIISDGEGNDRARDVQAAEELEREMPGVTGFTIGIEMNTVGEAELNEIATALHGRSWLIGRDALEVTLRDAVSLAGFHSDKHAGAGIDVALLAILVIAILGQTARAMRLKLSEAQFTMVVCVAAGSTAWLATRVLLPTAGTSLSWLATVQNAAYFMLSGLIFGAALAVAEGLYMGETRRAYEQLGLALPVAIFGGAIAGLIGQALFSMLSAGMFAGLISRHMTRALGWAVAGALIGACPGAAAQSKTRVQHGLIGGLLGGVAGGWLFESLGSGHMSRLVALISLGVAIGAMVRVVEQVAKQAWLVLMVGGPEGKEFILTKPVTTMGSHYQDDICVAGDRGYPLREAHIVRDGKNHYLEVVPNGRAQVDGEAVRGRVLLRSGASIRIGEGELVFQLRNAEGQDAPYRPQPGMHDARSFQAKTRPASRGTVLPVRLPERPEGVEFIESADDDDSSIIEMSDVQSGPQRKLPPRRS